MHSTSTANNIIHIFFININIFIIIIIHWSFNGGKKFISGEEDLITRETIIDFNNFPELPNSDIWRDRGREINTHSNIRVNGLAEGTGENSVRIVELIKGLYITLWISAEFGPKLSHPNLIDGLELGWVIAEIVDIKLPLTPNPLNQIRTISFSGGVVCIYSQVISKVLHINLN